MIVVGFDMRVTRAEWLASQDYETLGLIRLLVEWEGLKEELNQWVIRNDRAPLVYLLNAPRQGFDASID